MDVSLLSFRLDRTCDDVFFIEVLNLTDRYSFDWSLLYVGRDDVAKRWNFEIAGWHF